MRNGSAGTVLDASALLAYLQNEGGAEAVEVALTNRAVTSVVNYAEVLSRLGDDGHQPMAVHRQFRDAGLIGDLVEVVPLDEEDGVSIARLRMATRPYGLSLGDHACLATGLRLGWPVMTTDRAWATVDIGVPVHVIRR